MLETDYLSSNLSSAIYQLCDLGKSLYLSVWFPHLKMEILPHMVTLMTE